MSSNGKRDDSKVRAAIQELRNGLGDSQEQFARRLNVGVRTVARWETEQVPPQGVLITLWEIARAKNLQTVAGVFAEAIYRMTPVLHNPDLYAELQAKFTAFLQKKVVPNIIATDLTEEERNVLTVALAVLRTMTGDERKKLVSVITNPERFRQLLRSDAILRNIARTLREKGASEGETA